jgi:thioredoxin-dependent peroxiredoxin
MICYYLASNVVNLLLKAGVFILTVGDFAPNIVLESDVLKKYCLQDFKDHKLIVYFYPKNNTQGCTEESKSINAIYEELKLLNVNVVGISTDTLSSHLKFKTKYGLKFLLLSDEKHQMAEAFGVWVLKKNFGKEYMGIIRSTFILDEEGKIIKVFDKVKPSKHGDELLDFIRRL